MKNQNKKQLLRIAALFLAVLAVWILYNNTHLEVSEFRISSARLPKEFEGFRILQISDLHNAEFGKGNENLLSLISQTEPDILVITGDLIDSRRTDVDIALAFVSAAAKIAPVYYVTGNHEARVTEYTDLKTGMEKAGAVVLENTKIQLEKDGSNIILLGVNDPSFTESYLFGDSRSAVEAVLTCLAAKETEYTVLLSHRPELFAVYAKYGIDLVFSGHAHGGQFRLPFIGGLFAPNQGFFPKYDAGQFIQGKTTMIVSRGVGNSIIPLRIFNRPEIVVVELLCA